MRMLAKLIVAVLLLGALVTGWGWRNARARPVVRHATVELPGWPAGAPPMRVALIGDIHMGNPAMDAPRLARIVAQVNALKPALVLIAGDFIAGHDAATSAAIAPALAPLAGLRAPLGTVAVLGNHDHWTGDGAVRAALADAGITVIDNGARRFGLLTVMGVGDDFTDRDDIPAAAAAARRLPGPRLVLSHGPDIVPKLPADAALTLVSHTHCGQIVLPLWGAAAIPSRYDTRYLCGIIREPGRATIVTAGLGTSVVPLRYGAPPDLWLVTLRPPSRPRS